SGIPASIDGILGSEPSMRAYCGAASPAGCCHSADVGILSILLMNITWASGLIIVRGGMESSPIVPPGRALTFPAAWVYSPREDPAPAAREHSPPPAVCGRREAAARGHHDACLLLGRGQEAGARRVQDHLHRQEREQAVPRADAGVRRGRRAVPHHRRLSR